MNSNQKKNLKNKIFNLVKKYSDLEFKKEPNITNIDTIDTETPVNGPHKPPSAIVSVPKKLYKGNPG